MVRTSAREDRRMRILRAGAAAHFLLIRWTCRRLAEVSGALRAPDPGMGPGRASVVDPSCLLSKLSDIGCPRPPAFQGSPAAEARRGSSFPPIVRPSGRPQTQWGPVREWTGPRSHCGVSGARREGDGRRHGFFFPFPRPLFPGFSLYLASRRSHTRAVETTTARGRTTGRAGRIPLCQAPPWWPVRKTRSM